MCRGNVGDHGTGADWEYIGRDKPKRQNRLMEGFNGRLRDECLNEEVFSLALVSGRGRALRLDYNHRGLAPDAMRPNPARVANQVLRPLALTMIKGMAGHANVEVERLADPNGGPTHGELHAALGGQLEYGFLRQCTTPMSL